MTYYDDHRLSASKLKNYLTHDPRIAHYLESQSSGTTDAMRFGLALHASMEGIDPVVSPYDNYRTKEAQQWKKANPEAMKAEEAEVVRLCKDSIIFELESKNLLETYKTGEYEKEYFTETHKGKLDCINAGIILDWKTSAATSLDKVIRDAWNYKWALQASLYLDLSDSLEFWFVVVSKTAPYPAWALRCSHEFIEYGRTLRAKAESIRSSYLAGNYADSITLEAPPWSKESVDCFDDEVEL